MPVIGQLAGPVSPGMLDFYELGKPLPITG
jgi:hypothetical protein